MFPQLRTVATTGLRAARPAARQSTSLLARRQMSAGPSAGKKVEQGSAELWPFAKNIPVDVYPLAFLVTIVCSASVYMCGKHLVTDKSLRLRPSGGASH